MRLLLVEDSALIRTVTRLAFPSKEHEIQEAADGRQALAILDGTSRRFDAILLDLRMPEMNGVEFIRGLRERALHRDTPIVVASSESETSELVQQARELGVAAVVKKPWKPQELSQIVHSARAAHPQRD
jgi:CheY-like chemotaxis protein